MGNRAAGGPGKLQSRVPVGEGLALFDELKAYVSKHLNFSEPWHLDLYCVFLMQCALVEALPGVFYLFVGGRFASGKTSALRLAVRLAGGKLVENVSVAALARMLDGAGLVALDEVKCQGERSSTP